MEGSTLHLYPNAAFYEVSNLITELKKSKRFLNFSWADKWAHLSRSVINQCFFFLSQKNWIAELKQKGSPMSSSSDPSKTGMERKKKGAPIKFLVPLIYAPALPLIRLTLRHQPVLRDRLFGLVLAGAFAHGFYLVYPLFFFFFAFLSDFQFLLQLLGF